jgi:AraC-like DNA-binding protein
MKAFHEIRNYPSDFMVWQCAYENISFLAHWHQEIELIYVRLGTAKFCINDDEFTAKKGDLIVVDTEDFHYSASYECQNHLDFITFNPSVISQRYHHAHFLHPLVTAEMLRQYHLADDTDHLFDSVRTELQEQQPYYQDIVSAMLREYIYRLRRCHPRKDESADGSDSGRYSDSFHDMQNLLMYIDEHYNEDISLSFAAEMMNFSESHFSRVFKKMTGINFVTYLNAVRIEQAADMLKNTHAKVTDIALSCGFGNVRSFNRTFKDYTGYTPTQFLALPDAQSQHFSYYRRKLDQKEYVQNDSLTLVPNPKA